MRLLVVGPGGIGGFLAAALHRSGNDVTVVARGEHLEAIRRSGLRVAGSDIGAFDALVTAVADVRELQLEGLEAAFLTFKSHQWPDLLPQMQALSDAGVPAITLQNGLPFWFVREPPLQSVDPGGRIGRLFPDDRVAGGVIHVSGHVAAPGVVRQSGGTRYVLGDPRGGSNAFVEKIVAVLEDASLRPQADANIRETAWLKLVNNAGLNPVSTLRGLTIGSMLADPAARNEVRLLMHEALQVGQAMGVVRDADIDARIEYAARLDDVKTSMLQDRQRGRALELEPIVGSILELAQRCGVEVPHLRESYAALERLGAGQHA